MRVQRRSRSVVTYRPLFLAVALVLSALGVVTPAIAQEETGTVVIAKHACPLDFDAYTASPDELKENCPLADMFPPVTFDIDYGDGRVESVETKGALIMLMDVPAGGTMTLAEVLPEGMGEPVVFCSAKADGAETLEPTLVPVVNGNAVEIEPRAGETLSCFWFNVFGGAVASGDDAATGVEATPAAVEGATVEITVHGCAPGFDPASSADQFMQECTGHPVALLSAGDFDEYYEADTIPGVGGDYRVTFSGIPATDLTLSHLRPQSATTLAVFCADGDFGSLESMAVTGWGSLDREMTGSDALACHWFTDGGDVDGDTSGNTVEIRAWSCLPGTVSGEDSWSYYFDQCEQADTGTAFSLVDEAGERPATLAGDWSAWTGVGTSFTLQAAGADGAGEVVTVCGAYEGDHISIEWPVVTAGAFETAFSAGSGQVMSCDWFTIPA